MAKNYGTMKKNICYYTEKLWNFDLLLKKWLYGENYGTRVNYS